MLPGTTTGFADILELARLYRAAVHHLDVVGMPTVTGKRGVQIWIPLRPGYTFADARHWVETVSRVVGRTLPDLISWQWYRDQRGGLARLDYTQNAINETLVAPFSARPGRTGVDPDHLGRTRRPRTATRPLDHPHRP